MNSVRLTQLRQFLVGLALVLWAITPRAALAYGEGAETMPSWEERAVHLFTDRLRVEPGADDPEFETYDAVRPLVYNQSLNEAARFYADDMAEHGCFPEDHSSCDGTSFGDRLAGFYTGQFIGENISLGSPNAYTVVNDGWLYSPPHRDNMLSVAWLELGTGRNTAESNSRHWVQDFGNAGQVDEPITTSGVHWPLRPSPGESVSFYLAIHDPSEEPAGADFVVDGECSEMAHDRGAGNQRTYVGTTSLESPDCAPYYFVLTRMDGEKVTYPTTGTFLVPVGGAECPIWVEGRESFECNPEVGRPAFEGAGTGCGADPYEGGGPDSNVGDAAAYASCGAAGRGHPIDAHWLVLLLGLQGLMRRRGRSPAQRTVSRGT